MPNYEQNKKSIYNWRAKNRDKLNEQARKDNKLYYLKKKDEIKEKYYLRKELREFMNILID